MFASSKTIIELERIEVRIDWNQGILDAIFDVDQSLEARQLNKLHLKLVNQWEETINGNL